MQYNNIQKLFFLFSSLYMILSNLNNTDACTIDKIAAIVDKDIILESDIKQEIQQSNIKYNHNDIFDTKSTKPISRNQILNQLISDTLILQLAKKINIDINAEETNEMLNYITTQNNISNEEFKSHLKKHNIDYNNYIKEIQKHTLINTICNYEMNKRIKITPYEIKTLTEKLIQNNNTAFQFDHILIPLEENTTNHEIKHAYSLGESLIKKIKQGINIEKLKTLYTNNNSSPKIQFTKINWSTLEELPTLFSENLIKYTLTTNSVIGPIRSNVGLHILKINDIEHNIKKNIVTIVNIKNIFLQSNDIYENKKNKKELLEITEKIKNKNTTFSIELEQISKKYGLSNQYNSPEWKYLNEFTPEIQKILVSLKKGEISPPIQIKNGWLIIQLIDIKKVDKNHIIYQSHASQMIFNRKTNEEMNKWIEELKSINYIKIFNENNNI